MESPQKRALLFTAFGIIVLLLIGFLVYSTQTASVNTTPITVSPTPTQTVTPTPQQTTVQGTVVSKGTVAYKNAQTLTLNPPSTIYVIATTKILDATNNPTTFDAIPRNASVVAIGTPAEGGLEATEVRIVTTTTPSPTQRVSVSPTSGPTMTPAPPTLTPTPTP